MSIARHLLALGLCSLVSAAAHALSYQANLDGLQIARRPHDRNGVRHRRGGYRGEHADDPPGVPGFGRHDHGFPIHCCFSDPPSRNIGLAIGFTPTGFPLGVTSGSYDHVFDLLDPTIYTSAFLTNFGGGTAAGARDALINGFNSSTAYFNIHSSFRAGGEIRGDIFVVPEPATAVLLVVGLAVMGAILRRR